MKIIVYEAIGDDCPPKLRFIARILHDGEIMPAIVHEADGVVARERMQKFWDDEIARFRRAEEGKVAMKERLAKARAARRGKGVASGGAPFKEDPEYDPEEEEAV